MPGKLPTVVRIARGTQRKDRQGEPELEPQGAELKKMPAVPRLLGVAGKAFWKAEGPKLIQAGLLTELDIPQFRLLCELLDTKAKLEKIIKANGEYRETPEGWVTHPAVGRLDRTLDRIRAFAKCFGMSPLDRSGMQLSRKRKTGVTTRQRSG